MYNTKEDQALRERMTEHQSWVLFWHLFKGIGGHDGVMRKDIFMDSWKRKAKGER